MDKLALDQLEELAFALQIDYIPPLTEDDRKDILREITWIRDHKDEISEENIMRDRKRRRKRDGRMCDQVYSLSTNENLLLMSDQQLIFFPFNSNGKERYYCFTRYEVAKYLLVDKVNPYTNEPFSDEDILTLEKLLYEKKYPIIHINGLLTEIEERLNEKRIGYITMEYRDLSNEFVSIVEKALPDFKVSVIYDFATELSNDDYAYFLTDSQLDKKLEINIPRKDAASITLRAILNEYNAAKAIDENNAKLYIIRMALAIDEFYYMIGNDLDYMTLMEEKGKLTANGVKELYWKPKYLVEEKYDDGGILYRYFVDDNNQAHGIYHEYYMSGNLELLLNYEHGKQVGPQEEYHSNGRLHKRYTLDENERKQGKHKEYDTTGRKIGSYNYKDNKQVGLQKDYKNGILLVKYTLNEKERKEGLYEMYYPNGKIRLRVYYNSNNQEHDMKQLYDKSGNLKEEQNYVNGKRIGLQREYADNKLMSEYSLNANGNYEGVKIDYKDNGDIHSKHNYKDGVLHGPQVDYLEGREYARYNLNENGELEGMEEILDKYGKVVKVINHGRKTGLIEHYFPDGSIMERYYLDNNGLKQGEHVGYISNGKLKFRYNYVDDMRVGVQEEYKYGKLYRKYSLNDDGQSHGPYIQYHNGRIDTLTTYVNGERLGVYEEYEDGRLYRRSYINEDGNEDGIVEMYNDDGTRGEYTIKDGEAEGVQKEFYESGNIHRLYYVKDGVIEGDYIEYKDDNSGSILSISKYLNGIEVSSVYY